MILRTLTKSYELKHAQYLLLQRYTLGLLEHVSGKNIEFSNRIPFLLAPSGTSIGDQEPSIDWDEVERFQETNLSQPLSQKCSDAYLKDSIVTVGNEPNREFFVQEVLREYALDDTMPQQRFEKEIEEWKQQSQHENRVDQYPTFRQYLSWKFSCKHKFEPVDDDIIVIVQQIKRMRNNICSVNSGQKDLERRTSSLIPLSLCHKRAISACVLRMVQTIPSAIYDLDALLLAQEVQEKIGLHDVHLDYLQTALTTSSATRDFNYERLELLGDSFLKFSVTIRLYITHPTMQEGQLHLHRIEIVSNDSLLQHCLRHELYRHVSCTPFHRKDWHPEHFVVNNKKRCIPGEHKLANKTLADIVEATLGAAYLSGGHVRAFHAAKSLGIPFDEFQAWPDFHRVHQTTISENSIIDQEIAAGAGQHWRFHDQVQKLEHRLGYTFRHPHLILQAMTHASALQNDKSGLCYERLEFLGDAVLDFHVIQYYYHKYSDASPGAITLIKDASVNNQILGALALHWGLAEFLIHNSSSIAAEVERMIVATQAIKEKNVHGRLEGEYWVDVATPKILGDLVESTIGAVFVDCGFDVETIQDFFARQVQPFLDEHLSMDTIVLHPTKVLMEFLQSKSCNEAKFVQNDPENISGGGGGGGPSGTLKLLELDQRWRQKHQQQRSGQEERVLECNFLVHGSLVASATGLRMDELRKKVALLALRRLKTEEGLLESMCTCTRKRASGQSGKNPL
ncbi:hypothetical protein BG004_007319 [Podila humilis]|nr:hypothetical protein BG004_007319 [Podila humilis]